MLTLPFPSMFYEQKSAMTGGWLFAALTKVILALMQLTAIRLPEHLHNTQLTSHWVGCIFQMIAPYSAQNARNIWRFARTRLKMQGL